MTRVNLRSKGESGGGGVYVEEQNEREGRNRVE